MTNEELIAAIKAAESGEEGKKPAEPVKITVGGKELEAPSYEELAKGLAARVEAAERYARSQQEPEPVGSGELPKWDYDKFSKTFVDDPRQGLKYALQVETGLPDPIGAIKGLVGAVTQLAGQMQVMATEQFIREHPEYPKTPDSAHAIERVMQEYNQPWTTAGLERAYNIAVQEKLIKPVEQEKKQEPDYGPPRVGASTGAGEGIDELGGVDLYNMPMDKFMDVLQKAGAFSGTPPRS